jgi:hypothetical protein
MPKQKGPIILQGTIGDKTYYKMKGQHLVRKKSSLTKKRVKKDPAFAKSRKSSELFGKASKLVKKIYDSLPAKKKKHGAFGKFTGFANELLHAGKIVEQVKAKLMKKMA